MFSHLKLAIVENYPSVFNVDYEMAVIKVLNETFPNSRVKCCNVHFKRALRRKLVNLKQLVPPFHAHAIWVWKNHIKTSVPYEDIEQTIQDDPEKVDDFNEVTFFELT